MKKVRTWLRIKQRVAAIYIGEAYSLCEWPIRFLCNWLYLFSCPLWIGFSYILMYIYKAIESKKNVERSVLTGKVWFFRQHDLY